jgi:N-acyl-phosphatidylethanolamine-hydrolysing phospholipase D
LGVHLAGCSALVSAPSPLEQEAATAFVSAEAARRERAYFRRELVKYAFDAYGRGKSLPDSLVLDRRAALAAFKAAEGAPSATWIGHSTFLIEIAGTRILTDPVFSNRVTPLPPLGPERLAPPGLPFSALPPIDIVLISHNHYDHLDVPTLARLAARDRRTVVVAPDGTRDLLARAGFERIVVVETPERVDLGAVDVRAVFAQHNSGRGLVNEEPPHANGYLIEGNGLRLYFAGDTGYNPQFREIGRRLGPVDVAFVPIGAYTPEDIYFIYHLNPEDAVRLARDFGADLAVAMHWGTFALSPEPILEPPQRFLAAPSPGLRKIVPRIGETIRLACPDCAV